MNTPFFNFPSKQPNGYYSDDLTELVLGDARVLLDIIPDESIDVVFTDPPYLKKFLYLYDWLGKEIPRVLKPDGFLLAYAGVYWKENVMWSLGAHLSYYWDFALVNAGPSPIIWNRNIISRYKSILCYSKGKGKPNTPVLGMWKGSGADKRYHTWGQDESSARYYIDVFSHKNDVILDPFVGGGTTPAVCKLLGLSCVGFELDPEAFRVAGERLSNTNARLNHLQFNLELNL